MRKPQPQEPHGLTGRVFGWLMQRMNARSYRDVLRIVDPNGLDVLEIGFGTGEMLRLMETKGAVHIAGVDPSELMVETAQAKVKQADLHKATASALPWPDNSFDLVVALHSFQFWEPVEHCLEEVLRVLREKGQLLLVLRDHGAGEGPDWLPNPISRSIDEVDGTIKALLAAGFETAASVGKSGNSTIVLARNHT